MELLNFGVEIYGGVGLKLDGQPVGEILEEDGGIGPLKVPAVLESEEGVAAGENGGHGEGAVGVGLVAVKLGRVMVGILRDEKDHGAGEGFSILEGDTRDGAFGFSDMDSQLDRLTGGNVDGAMGNRGPSGLEGADLKRRLLIGEVHLISSRRKRRAREREFSFAGDRGLVGFAGFARAEFEREHESLRLGHLVGTLLLRLCSIQVRQNDSGDVR